MIVGQNEGPSKELIRTLTKVVGDIAGVVLLIAPTVSYNGLVLMVGSAIVGLMCFAGYKWSEPDEDQASSEDSN
jgi:hypothetical protein